jgi:hypothetical protein
VTPAGVVLIVALPATVPAAGEGVTVPDVPTLPVGGAAVGGVAAGGVAVGGAAVGGVAVGAVPATGVALVVGVVPAAGVVPAVGVIVPAAPVVALAGAPVAGSTLPITSTRWLAYCCMSAALPPSN